MVNFIDSFAVLAQSTWTFLGTLPVLLCISAISFIIKGGLLVLFGVRGARSSKLSTPLTLLLLVLLGGMTEDMAWFLKLLDHVFNLTIDPRLLEFFSRIAWGFVTIRYQALSLFIENLSEKNAKLKIHQIIFLIISTIFFLFFVGLAITQFNNPSKLPLQAKMIEFVTIYTLLPLMCTSLVIALWKLKSATIPLLIKRQLKVLIRYLVIPIVAADFIQTYPFRYVPTLLTQTYSLVGISTIILTITIYYGARKVMGLRFLNLYEHVRNPKGFDFMKDFKNVLEQFSHASSERELTHITQNFFKEAFNLPKRTVSLSIRDLGNSELDDKQEQEINTDNSTVENFISTHDEQQFGSTFLKKRKIVIHDELAFSNFYEHDESREQILHFMTNINADIFIPVYDKTTLIAYIIVERYARAQEAPKNAEFYSSTERDQMVVFAAYLGNIIHLLRSRNLNTLIAQEKELREELYDKHQKINQYKEAIRSFLRTNKEKKIGIIFYKNRKFTFGNQTAHELIQVNLNTHDGHPITKTIKHTATQALEYKSQQTGFVLDQKGNKLVISAIPNSEQNNVIIAIYYPEISDILKKKIELLSDPTKWDYLLYLETTKSGKLIDQLIPGTGETLLNFKIDLLKIALSRKAILLDMPSEDLMPTVELLHHISLRETLHTLDPQRLKGNMEAAIKLFGINPIFGINQAVDKPLLEKLDGEGTLFIHNINLLDMETQDLLAEFLKYGIYQVFKSDQKKTSDVRIICSTNQDLQELVREGRFSKSLFEELNKTSLCMPSLLTLPENELENLAAGFSEQAMRTDTFKNLFELTDKEKRKLAVAKPASLQELKTRVQQMLTRKSQANEIGQETQFDPAYNISDPELAEAARLGKYALKDPKIMALLWKKFKNQNKIAAFLGVNRSSINRRCKEYNLE